MEYHETLVVLLLVLNVLSVGQSVGRSAVFGCALHQHLCKPDEDCNQDVYPFGECQKTIFEKHPEGKTNKRFRQNGEVDVGLPSGDVAKRISAGITSEENRRHADRDGSYQNDKYDMTYFENYDSLSERPYESRETVARNSGLTGRDPVNRDLDRAQRNQYKTPLVYVRHDSSHRLKHKRTFQHDENKDDKWPPIGIPISFPLKHARHVAMETRDSKLEDKETVDGKRAAEVAEPQKVKQEPENENSLDFDIEIKPLSLSDSKYFEGEKTKLSSIPKKPSAKKEIPQKIEHIQTNIVDTNPAKKTEVGVLIGGKLDQAKTNLVHEKSTDQTYDKVKDFFKSQQVSSLVDAPIAEKRENVKFYSLSSGEENVNVKRSSIPTPSIYPDGIKLQLAESLDLDKASDLLSALQGLLWGPKSREAVFTSVDFACDNFKIFLSSSACVEVINNPAIMHCTFLENTEDSAVLFHMLNNTTTSGGNPSSVVERINQDKSLKSTLNKALGVTILSASLQSKDPEEIKDENNHFMLTTLIVAGCVTGILLASVCIFIILKRTQENSKWVPRQAGHEAASDYQSLWRQLRQATWETPIHTPSVAHSDNGEQKGILGNKDLPPKYSWSEEPVDTKMDISTGHVVLAYMEDHLKNENRLSKEWEDLSIYEAEPDRSDVGKDPKNNKKNRYSDVLPFDHNRVKLRETSNATGSDYINASYIIDDDPRTPAYIATQGPLGSTVADFWQMIWEQGVVVIVMLTKLADLGLPQCHRYWPEKGHDVYHIYQVHLISEHIWCSDYLVRSFYLKNVQTGETRTVTQFHYLTWPHLGIPISSKPLLDFRRKVLKCFRSHSCPVVVHCSGGIDRTGTYILIDMVLSKMSKGTKEIDIAATLEHLRDQRPQMVKTKAQFEFALTSVAEEVNAILQVLTKH